MISDEFGFDLFFTVKAALLAEMEEEAALDPFLRAGCPGEEDRYAGLCIKHKNWCGDKKKNLWTSERTAVSKSAVYYGEVSGLAWEKQKAFGISAECGMPQWTRKLVSEVPGQISVLCSSIKVRVTARKNFAWCLNSVLYGKYWLWPMLHNACVMLWNPRH